ncbi:MAG: hypothetical protein ABIB55_00820 [Candidatus Nealsonbacteria bacterium]
MLKDKLKEWLKRYAFAHIVAVITAVLIANLSHALFKNIILSAFLATWSDNIAYYGIIIYGDLKSQKKKDKQLKTKSFLKVARGIVVEFGPAEYLDSFIIRPFYLSVFPYFIPNYPLAILIGSMCAEVTFYIPTIISYELKKKLFKD